MLEPGLNVFAHQGNDDKDTKEAVNYAGDGGKQVDKELKRVRNSCGRQFREKNGRADAEGDGDQQRYHRGDERAVNEGQRTELIENRIPDGGAEKMKPNLCRGRTEPCHNSKTRSKVTSTTEAANKNVMIRTISSPSRSRDRNEREPATGLALGTVVVVVATFAAGVTGSC